MLDKIGIGDLILESYGSDCIPFFRTVWRQNG